jgi:hypothetical protein
MVDSLVRMGFRPNHQAEVTTLLQPPVKEMQLGRRTHKRTMPMKMSSPEVGAAKEQKHKAQSTRKECWPPSIQEVVVSTPE